MPGYPHLNEVPLSGQQLAERVAKTLEPMSPSERAEFLEQEERKACASGDLEILRAIREYNKALRLSTPLPPKDSA